MNAAMTKGRFDFLLKRIMAINVSQFLGSDAGTPWEERERIAKEEIGALLSTPLNEIPERHGTP